MNKDILDICWKKRNGELSLSWDMIATMPSVVSEYGFITGEALRSKFKKYRKKTQIDYLFNTEIKATKHVDLNKPRLIISDIHLPFAVDGWLDFIKTTHKKFDCEEEIIINGDLLDFHAYSFHTTETDAFSAIDEFDKAKEMITELVEAFPKARFITGNHDMLIVRRIKELGIDKRFTKTFHEMLGLPETWVVSDDAIINNVFYKHIGCCGGKTGHINSAISNRMSTVSSHLHADGGISYATSPNGETIFGLNTGALVDDTTYAFRYGINSRFKTTLGCGIVVSDKEAYFVPMIK